MCEEEFRLVFDTARVEEQLEELRELLLKSPHNISNDLKCLGSDVVLGDAVPALVAGETVQVIALRFGARFENFMAALRAGDGGGHSAHVLNGLRGLLPVQSR
jgi:hypothetical protein